MNYEPVHPAGNINENVKHFEKLPCDAMVINVI